MRRGTDQSEVERFGVGWGDFCDERSSRVFLQCEHVYFDGVFPGEFLRLAGLLRELPTERAVIVEFEFELRAVVASRLPVADECRRIDRDRFFERSRERVAACPGRVLRPLWAW